MTETVIEQCRRHVAEGAQRITRQHVLIAKLERNGHQSALPNAYVLLAGLQDTQRLSEEHLAREIIKQARPQDPWRW